jgi:zinc protease
MRLLSIISCSVLTACAPFYGLPRGSDPLPVDPGVRVGELENGLRYYVRENREPRARAELRLVVNAGSILEEEDQRGLAHLVEHMAFNGTEHFEKQALVDYLERIGMRFGPDVNAYTSFDETVYLLTVPTDSAGLLETGLQILEDWSRGVSFDSVEVEKERGVVIEEWRLGQGAGARMQEKQFPVLLRGSRYAERMPIGTRESLESFEVEAARRFYREWYRPELMAVVAVGDFEGARMEELIRAQFADLPSTPGAPERRAYEVPDHRETLVAIATDREAPYTSVGVLYKQDPQAFSTAGDYRREIVERLYNGMLNNRLSELAQEADPPFAGAYSGQGRLLRPKDGYQLSAQVQADGIERGLDALLTEARRVDLHGFAASELERQKTNLLRGMEQAYVERGKAQSAGFASEYVGHFLTDEPIPGIEEEYRLYQALLPGISLEEVNRLGREWITDYNRVIMVNAPEREGVSVPDETALLAVFAAAEGRQLAAYDDAVSDQPLLEVPEAGRVVDERAVDAVGVTEWRLSNGVRVLLKPTDFKDDEILVTAYSPGGTSLASDDQYIAATTAVAAVGAGGLGDLDPVELRKRLTGKVVQVGPFINTLEEGMQGSGSTRDLETLLQLVHLYFTDPREDPEAFQSLLARARADLEQRSSIPEQAFADTVRVVMSGHHPRAQPFTTATLERMNLDASLEFYRERFADASDFTFVFVGSFDPQQLRPLIETYVASLPSTGRVEAGRDVGIEVPRGLVQREVRRGIEPKSQTQLVFAGPISYTIDELHAMRSMTQLLETRLRDELREEQSGTYGVSVRGSSVRLPRPEYRIDLSFGSAPERGDELLRLVMAHIDSLHRVPPSAEEVATVRELQRRVRETDVRQNGYWLNAVSSYDRNGWPLEEISTASARTDALTAETIQNAARRLMDLENYAVFRLLPEANP